MLDRSFLTLLVPIVVTALSPVDAETTTARFSNFFNKEEAAKWRLTRSERTPGKTGARADFRESVSYTRKPFDPDSEGYLFKFRTFDADAGRWRAPDPNGFPDGANNFACGGNPLSGVDPDGLAWSNWDFVGHYYTGGGTSVTLAQIGHLSGVQSAAHASGTGGAARFGAQIQSDAQARADANHGYTGNLTNSFSNSYDFGNVIYSLGSAILSGSFSGVMTSTPNPHGIGGTFEYNESGSLRAT